MSGCTTGVSQPVTDIPNPHGIFLNFPLEEPPFVDISTTRLPDVNIPLISGRWNADCLRELQRNYASVRITVSQGDTTSAKTYDLVKLIDDTFTIALQNFPEDPLVGTYTPADHLKVDALTADGELVLMYSGPITHR